MNDDDQQIFMLVEMGFEKEHARKALQVCSGNVERAIEYLFAPTTTNANDDGAARARDPPNNSTNNTTNSAAAVSDNSISSFRDVVASISQYSLDQGRSACTCIALTAAQEFLQRPSLYHDNNDNDNNTMTPEFLERVINHGVHTYMTLQSIKPGVEHMSAEETLEMTSSSSSSPPVAAVSSSGETGPKTFQHLQLIPGGIRQGILGSVHNGMGLSSLLTACQQEQPISQWMAILITKTPETILVLFPPPHNSSTSTASQSQSQSQSSPLFAIVDSHPRPGIVQGGSGAYARIVPTLQDVVCHLSTILPATELGPDIPEMMAMMYNSFDLYPLIWKD